MSLSTGAAPAGAVECIDADTLTEALVYEARMLEDLRESLSQQRDAVARNDAGLIEASLQAMGRTLLTLEEARRRRQSLVALLAGHESVTLSDLDRHLGLPLGEALEEARAEVRRVATATARDLAINQHVLDRAFQAGDAFLQRLFSTVGAGYHPEHQADPKQGAVMVNRTA